MEDLDFTGANLIEPDLGSLQMRGAKLVGVRLYGADLTPTNLIDADLRQAKLGMANLPWSAFHLSRQGSGGQRDPKMR